MLKNHNNMLTQYEPRSTPLYDTILSKHAEHMCCGFSKLGKAAGLSINWLWIWDQLTQRKQTD